MSEEITSERFFQRLEALASPPGREVIRRHRESGKGWRGKDDIAIGLRMAQVFGLAKQFVDMPPAEIERLLESPIHEVRVGALSIMDKQARTTRRPKLAGSSCSIST
jgi:hypothetical protein